VRRGRPQRLLMLEAADQEKLELLARQPKIVLRPTERLSNQEIARRLGVTGATVGKWKERYRVQGMRLIGCFAHSAPREITDAKVEEAVSQTLARTASA
jgi:transposase